MATCDEVAPATQPRQVPKLTRKTLFVIGAMNMIDCINCNLLTPYVDEMVSDFLGLSPDDPQVGHTVGLLVGLYSLCEVIFSVVWGAAADRFGRKPTLLIGLAGSVVAPIMFGLGKSLPVVFVARALDGLFCGNMGVARTYLGEVCDASNEAQAFALLSVCYSLGLFIGPILGGQLVHPARLWPSLFAGGIFETYPYLLPNLVYAVFAGIAWVIGALFLQESLPVEARRPLWRRSSDEARRLRRTLTRTWTGTDPAGAPRSYPMEAGEGEAAPNQSRGCRSYPRALLDVILVFVALSGAVAASSQLFVLMVSFPAEKGGFGFGPADIGAVQNAAAAGLLLTQQFLYPRLCARIGLFKTFAAGWSLYVVVWALFPLYNLFADFERFGTTPAYVSLCILQALGACGCGLCFPTAFVFINRVSEGLDRGTVNGWSNSCGALSRALWPPATAWLLGVGAASGLPDGLFLALHANLLLGTVAMVVGRGGLRAADGLAPKDPAEEGARAEAAADPEAPAAPTERPRLEGGVPLIDG